MPKSYQNIKINHLPKRELEIEGEISKETMAEMSEKALTKIKGTIEMDGFRKGNVPENLIIQKIGEMKILEEAAQMALESAYPEILESEKIEAIGRPEITITKIAPENALGFKIKTALTPHVELSDYKKIARELSGETGDMRYEVTEKKIDDVIKDVRRNVAHNRLHHPSTTSTGSTSSPQGSSGQASSGQEKHDHKEITDADLPEIDAQFLKEIGEPVQHHSFEKSGAGFASLDDLRAKIKENMTLEKEAKAKDKKRTAILENIIKDSKIEIPKIIIDSELEKMLAQFKDDIARAKVNYTDYLAQIKKSEDDLKKEWQQTAEKRAKSQIILSTIAKEENITPKEEDIKKEMETILSHNKDLERFRVRMFVEGFLTNELVFQYLEKID